MGDNDKTQYVGIDPEYANTAYPVVDPSKADSKTEKSDSSDAKTEKAPAKKAAAKD